MRAARPAFVLRYKKPSEVSAKGEAESRQWPVLSPLLQGVLSIRELSACTVAAIRLDSSESQPHRPRTSLAFGSKPDGSIDALLQFIHGAGTAALGCCLPAAQFWTAVNLVSIVSTNLRIWSYGVEQSDAGESIEREESQ
jgi:hypothetical protein